MSAPVVCQAPTRVDKRPGAATQVHMLDELRFLLHASVTHPSFQGYSGAAWGRLVAQRWANGGPTTMVDNG